MKSSFEARSRFLDFVTSMKRDLASKEDFMKQVRKVADGEMTREEMLQKFHPDYKKQLQDNVLKYLRDNRNHLHTYFLPEKSGDFPAPGAARTCRQSRLDGVLRRTTG